MSGITSKALASLIYGIRRIFDDGTEKPLRDSINMIGFTVADDPTNKRTNITATGGVTLSGSVASLVAAASAAGSAGTASKSDHVHGHGDQAGGTTHAVASGAANGFMPAAHYTRVQDGAFPSLSTTTDITCGNDLTVGNSVTVSDTVSADTVVASTVVETPTLSAAEDATLTIRGADSSTGSEFMNVVLDLGRLSASDTSGAFVVQGYDGALVQTLFEMYLDGTAGGTDTIDKGNVLLYKPIRVTHQNDDVWEHFLDGTSAEFRVLDTSENVVFRVKRDGEVTIGFDSSSVIKINATTATTPVSGGAADALPANPVGYLRLTINGTIRKFPYYADT